MQIVSGVSNLFPFHIFFYSHTYSAIKAKANERSPSCVGCFYCPVLYLDFIWMKFDCFLSDMSYITGGQLHPSNWQAEWPVADGWMWGPYWTVSSQLCQPCSTKPATSMTLKNIGWEAQPVGFWQELVTDWMLYVMGASHLFILRVWYGL